MIHLDQYGSSIEYWSERSRISQGRRSALGGSEDSRADRSGNLEDLERAMKENGEVSDPPI